ncbi:MAG: bile acid:sodium symporter family protein [Synergistaceae bacterium]|nr:bile acid:sodium symporter family protein [Synergistaceae bacterium]MBQ3448449.1 bile acid:sodium symporter family protein [Synergistaceae bacterium]
MNFLRKLSDSLGQFMAVVVIIAAALALFVPSSASWIQTEWINPILMIIMFGMGLNLSLDHFKLLSTKPLHILLGIIAQFAIMPALALFLSLLFKLDADLMTGVVLVGTCPGGVASNAITSMSKGDTTLSVEMTSINTILAPFATPAITSMLLNIRGIEVDTFAMTFSIIQVVIIPIVLGLTVSKIFPKINDALSDVSRIVSMIAVCLIAMSVISRNAEQILSSGLLIFTVVILHNLLGYVCGFMLGSAIGVSDARIKALSIEVGIQNSSLAVSLAENIFPGLAMAAVPGALFTVWHNISGALLALLYRQWE